MSHNFEAPLRNREDIGAKLQQLIDATGEYHNREMTLILDLWTELKEDPTKRLVVDDFKISNELQSLYSNFLIKTNSPAVFALWNMCFAAAVEKLNVYQNTDINIDRESVTCRMLSADMERVLLYLRPLSLRTDFSSGSLVRQSIKYQFSNLIVSDAESQESELLVELVNHALEYKRNEGNTMLRYWENLKNDPYQRIDVRQFAISTSGNSGESNISLCFSYRSCNFADDEYVMWRCLLATTAAKFPPFAPAIVTNEECIDDISASFNTEIAGKLFEYLTPLIQRMQIYSLIFREARPEIVKMFSTLCEEITTHEVNFFREETISTKLDWVLWLDIIRKV